MEYGVQTHNKFAFLDEDVSDPEETLTKAEEEKKKMATTPQQKKPIAKPAVVTKPIVKDADKPRNNERKEGSDQAKPAVRFRNDRAGGGSNRDQGQNRGQPRQGGPRRPPQNIQKDGNEVANNDDKRMPNGRPPRPRNDYNKEGGDDRPPRRGPPRGGGGMRGGPRDHNRGPPRNQRSSDQSENKTDEPKPKENEENNEENPAEKEVADAEQKVNDENVENVGGEAKKEEEEEQVPPGKTYKEWKEELSQKAIEAAQFNTRKPGEGADQKIYQKLVPMKKPEKKSSKGNEETQDETAQHKEKREKMVNIEVAFVDKRFGAPGRTGFGTDRGERGGPPRGERQGQTGRGPGGPRGGGGAPSHNNFGSGQAGPSRRPPQGKQNQGGNFTLENDQFPALGAR